MATHLRYRENERPGISGSGQVASLRISSSSLITTCLYFMLLGSTWREFTGNENLFQISGYQFTIFEPIGFALLSLILVNFSSQGVRGNIALLFGILFSFIFILSLIRGVAVDFQRALFFARAYMIIPLSIIAACSIKVESFRDRDALDLIFKFGVLLSLVFYFKYATGFGIYDAHGRPVFTWAAFIIVAAFSINLIVRNRNRFRKLSYFFALLFIGAIIGSGQGTALFATLMIVSAVFVLGDGSALPRSLRLFILLLVFLGLLLSWSLLINEISGESLIRSWAEERIGTSGGRQAVWNAFLAAFDARSFFDQLFGLPMGQRDTLIVALAGNRVWEHSLHNALLEVLAFSGYVGLGLFVACILAAIVGCVRLFYQRADPRMTILATAFVIMMLSFGVSYDYRGDAALHLFMPFVLVRRCHLRTQRALPNRVKA